MSSEVVNTEASTNVINIAGVNRGTNKDGTPESADANKMNNAKASANAGTETAQMTLRGYPSLKAKKTVEITGVGKGSGIWYCKTVIHEWNISNGYITNVMMTKGKGGSKAGTNNDAHGNEAVTPPPPP